MVQKPCTPIRSAKGNPARPLIGGPPLRGTRPPMARFTGQGPGLLEQVGTGPHWWHRSGARPAPSQHGHQRQHRAPHQGKGGQVARVASVKDRPASQPLALGTANRTRSRGWVSFVPCLEQSPCTPIRSAKANPARPLIGGPPLRVTRTQWRGFTGQGQRLPGLSGRLVLCV